MCFLSYLCSQLKEEFDFITRDSKSLMAEFQGLKSKVLTVARSSPVAASVLAELDEESSEGNFTALCGFAKMHQMQKLSQLV